MLAACECRLVGETLQVLLELPNGKLACFTFAPDEPIVAHVIGRVS